MLGLTNKNDFSRPKLAFYSTWFRTRSTQTRRPLGPLTYFSVILSRNDQTKFLFFQLLCQDHEAGHHHQLYQDCQVEVWFKSLKAPRDGFYRRIFAGAVSLVRTKRTIPNQAYVGFSWNTLAIKGCTTENTALVWVEWLGQIRSLLYPANSYSPCS